MYQKTIKNKIEFSGVGLHTGANSRVVVLPTEADTGICFVRKDLPGTSPIRAGVSSVVATSYATTLGSADATVSTVEHLLAAFYALGVDNASVEVEGPEIPVLDGSAAPFVEMIREAGLKTLESPKRYMVIKKPIKVSDGDRFIHLIPSRDEEFSIDYTIDFPHPYLQEQSFSMSFSSSSSDIFSREVAGARTFGFLREVKLLRANGLAKGGSLDNAVVVGDMDILNEGGLRYPDEFVRHKVLDFIGDLSLIGVPLIGRIKAHRAGHSLNYKLAQKVLKNPGRWEMVDAQASAFEKELEEPCSVIEQRLATA
jgi:UDP-3-O-[3-hydroxymyristoyl] N-acetylglucosamine deacetylase